MYELILLLVLSGTLAIGCVGIAIWLIATGQATTVDGIFLLWNLSFNDRSVDGGSLFLPVSLCLAKAKGVLEVCFEAAIRLGGG